MKPWRTRNAEEGLKVSLKTSSLHSRRCRRHHHHHQNTCAFYIFHTWKLRMEKSFYVACVNLASVHLAGLRGHGRTMYRHNVPMVPTYAKSGGLDPDWTINSWILAGTSVAAQAHMHRILYGSAHLKHYAHARTALVAQGGSRTAGKTHSCSSTMQRRKIKKEHSSCTKIWFLSPCFGTFNFKAFHLKKSTSKSQPAIILLHTKVPRSKFQGWG